MNRKHSINSHIVAAAMAVALSTQTMYSQEKPRLFDEMAYTPERTVFHLNAPTGKEAKGVRVRIYDQGLDGKAVKTVRMKAAGDDRWEATVKGDLDGKFYTFDAGRGETPGIFAKAVGVNGRRGAIVDMAQTDPEGWADDQRPPLASPADLVVYEMHFRDFSVSPTSGLKHKGKFLALTEPKAIAHLKRLGVNAVHLLPSFDYASVDETQPQKPQYNWGYDPLNYNVPEGSYATDARDPKCRIREFKTMVQALHKAGIRVILDVVYNHTFDLENSNFQRTWPDRYYRFAADGKPSNGSGCGNETASEWPVMRQFMTESVCHWVNEYHIDGFRFDLMGVHDIETMNAIRAAVDAIDPSIYIYGEGWSAGQCALPTGLLATKANTPLLHGIGAFCDDMRDALRGPFDDDTKGGFLAGVKDQEESIRFGIAGCIDHPQIDMAKVNYSKQPWANEPTQMMAYVSCHDDMCLVDRLRASVPGIGDDELVRLDLLAQTAVLTSQGVPFLLSGEEMLRDKKGVHNSFCSPDSVNALDWGNLDRHPEVFSYYSNLIALRRAHPAFRLGRADLVRRHLRFLPSPSGTVAFHLHGLQGIDPSSDIIVVINANREAKAIDIPEGQYTIVAKDGVADDKGLGTATGATATVNAQSALILKR